MQRRLGAGPNQQRLVCAFRDSARSRHAVQIDFAEALTKITVPALMMHGDDGQIAPYADSGPLSARLVQHESPKTYPGFPDGMPTTQAQTINTDLLAFIQS